MKSIVQADENHCFVCGSQRGLEYHHIMHGTANRRLSTRYGLTCYLCYLHHRGRFGVHSDADMNRRLQRVAQKAFEDIHGHEMWMEVFKKNYL